MTDVDAQVAAAGAGGVALMLGLLLTEPLRRFALYRGIADHPSARKAHTRPTPYLGGVAIAVATLAAGAGAAFAGRAFDPVLGVLLVGAALMCVLGLVDDLRQLSPGIRLCAETVAAAVVVLVGGHPDVFGGTLDVVLSVLWIVFVMNAFNLLDNMDGAASSLCVVISGFLCLTALAEGAAGMGVVMAALAGSCLGFLFYNRHPARIFLGDAGSLFLGFTLASAMMVVHGDVEGLGGPASLLLATLVPTLDTTLVMLSRYLESRPLLQGGTDHIAHRLRWMGMTVQQVVRCLSVFAVVCCLSATLVIRGLLAPGVALAAACLVGAGAVGLLLKVPSGATVVRCVDGPARSPVAGRTRLAMRLRDSAGARNRTGPLQPVVGPPPQGGQATTTLSPTAGAAVTQQ
ncbi:MraY family glycosyltransferase [Streptomyces naganishii]|uniref:MraY family glycosyltransferase n=1 Tax=Streptomyces naganishii TaxID=285447 RepID=UPI00369901F0